jgi:hypothetical protein
MRELVNRELGGDATRVERLDGVFTGMVVPGSDITLRLLARGDDDPQSFAFEVLNAEGQKAIRNGRLVASR